MTNQMFAYRLPNGRVELSPSRRLDYEMTDDHVRLDAEVSRTFDPGRPLLATLDGWYVYE